MSVGCRCAEGFNSGVKGLILRDLLHKFICHSLITVTHRAKHVAIIEQQKLLLPIHLCALKVYSQVYLQQHCNMFFFTALA